MTDRIVVIGASFSRIDALAGLLGALPPRFPVPILIAQRIASHSPGMLPDILSEACRMPVAHPRSAQLIEPGHIYVAPPDRHMLVRIGGYISLSHGPHENFARPAIDPLFRSAALVYGPAVIGVVLTGELDDGTAGLLAVKACGGTTVVQEPAEATAPSMPLSALHHVQVDHTCRLGYMARLLTRLAADTPAEPTPDHARALMEIENRIAEGIFTVDDWWQLEQMSVPSGLNCPQCHSALYELTEQPMLRFRCRSGHGFSALTLLSRENNARESQLSAIFGILVEEITLSRRLLADPAYATDLHITSGLAARIVSLENEAAQISDWLHAMTGLVEPEPGRDDSSTE
ncbi:MAG TPA: chemotaxis protein CheB [Methylocella sp.]|nr:chemotaxis protein CheB [Methylocella sp.]